MNYLIQRGKVRGQVINVPDGLPELLSDIAREVLRCQPAKECLCQFIIDYLHTVIVTRDKALVAKVIIDRALRKVDEIIDDMCICDITKEKAEEMSTIMEECFKRFLEKRRCERGKEKEIIRFDEEDVLDELINRCKFSEDELKISRPLIEEAYNRFVQAYMSAAENTEGTEALYQYFRERELRRWEEKMRNEAALKIQATFRGYLVRRSLIDKMLPKIPHTYHAGPLGEIPSALYHDMDKAARVIQNFFRKRIPALMKKDEGVFEEEDQSICSEISQETVIDGQTPPAEVLPTKESIEMKPDEIELQDKKISVTEEPAEKHEEVPAEIEPEPKVVIKEETPEAEPEEEPEIAQAEEAKEPEALPPADMKTEPPVEEIADVPIEVPVEKEEEIIETEAPAEPTEEAPPGAEEDAPPAEPVTAE